mmetsp:Transcript_89150/g.260632  ORF Transcript_89150/g.260632 Transcript_89150/m.260632 type:complete len:262 (+) Transcript_89150:269-1054(+)
MASKPPSSSTTAPACRCSLAMADWRSSDQAWASCMASCDALMASFAASLARLEARRALLQSSSPASAFSSLAWTASRGPPLACPAATAGSSGSRLRCAGRLRGRARSASACRRRACSRSSSSEGWRWSSSCSKAAKSSISFLRISASSSSRFGAFALDSKPNNFFMTEDMPTRGMLLCRIVRVDRRRALAAAATMAAAAPQATPRQRSVPEFPGAGQRTGYKPMSGKVAGGSGVRCGAAVMTMAAPAQAPLGKAHARDGGA